MWRIVMVQALACCATVGAGVAYADPTDLPNANLPGNSATLPSSNLPGPVTLDQPIMLPNTDSSGTAVTEARATAALQQRAQVDLDIRDQTMRLAAQAAAQSALARAAAVDAQHTLQKAVEQQQP
ncbi:MAG TPA: hypothetical protein VGH63_11045 [Polyangia bacterium]